MAISSTSRATTEETIAAIATAPGVGGIGIIRVSGPASKTVLEKVFQPAGKSFTEYVPWKLHHGHIVSDDGARLDDALAVFMPGPHTFTGEDVAELHCHGGPALLSLILDEVLRIARPARRGEFSRRAFLNGRMDLSQAEAVAELIAAPSKEGAELALGKLDGILSRRVAALREQLETLRANMCLAVDFPEDEVDGMERDALLAGIRTVSESVGNLLAGVERTRCWREGVVIALAGPVNAGKSSLMNALLGRSRAIVTEQPGTTRDFLEESVMLAGLPARLVDTAGLRPVGWGTQDAIEAEGIRMGLARASEADVCVVLIDGMQGLVDETLSLLKNLNAQRTIVAWNKNDVAPAPSDFIAGRGPWNIACAGRVVLSARTGQGLEELALLVRSIVLGSQGARASLQDEVAPNVRQAVALQRAYTALCDLAVDVTQALPYELCLIRLEEAAQALGSVTGIDTTDEVLNRIFESFCIGK